MREEGQAVLDLLITSTLIALTITGAGWVLRAQWDRARCAHLVFEKAHARLFGLGPGALSVGLRVADAGDAVEAEAQCGDARERVRLRKLEKVQSW